MTGCIDSSPGANALRRPQTKRSKTFLCVVQAARAAFDTQASSSAHTGQLECTHRPARVHTGPHRSTTAPQHRSTAAQQHRNSTTTPQLHTSSEHSSTAAQHHETPTGRHLTAASSLNDRPARSGVAVVLLIAAPLAVLLFLAVSLGVVCSCLVPCVFRVFCGSL